MFTQSINTKQKQKAALLTDLFFDGRLYLHYKKKMQHNYVGMINDLCV